MKRIVLPIAILAGSVAIAILLIRNPTEIEETAAEIQPVSVRVVEATLGSSQLTVHSQGKVQAAQRVNLSAPVAGPVSWVSPALEPGGFIEAGEPLLRIDASDYETAAARGRASVQQAEAELAFAEDTLRRTRDLAERSLASQAQLQEAERTLSVTQARLADAQASLRQATLDLERTELTAPFTAVIESKDVELGQFINRAQNVAVLYGADLVEVRVPLAIRQLGFLDIPLGFRGELTGDRAPEVRLTGMYGGEQHQWQGRLVRIEAAIDEESNAVQSIIRVNQPDRTASSGWSADIPLPIGLYVQAEIGGREVDNVIALPRGVIRNNSQVLVVDAEKKMYFRDVEILRLEEDTVLISGGIRPGELICISPIQAVYDGMPVHPVRELI
ncbi:MAG: efflux RND transporter periplasmic adaptor subunit [Gammaproteobacteria bacterium]|nr:efflux RND transporter periplasmic adaptor subunit [Pseudomonadales bacterium]MCP5348886.1 efflux RND transporter periplasmic adaptor subunit [Pseudomonadales bacterium]